MLATVIQALNEFVLAGLQGQFEKGGILTLNALFRGKMWSTSTNVLVCVFLEAFEDMTETWGHLALERAVSGVTTWC